MDDKTVKDVHSIWGNKENRDRLRILIQNRPTILDIKDKLYEKINKYLKSKDDEIDDKNTGEPWSNWALCLRVKALNRKTIPVTFLFYDDERKENTPALRIVLRWEEFERFTNKRIKEYKEKDGSLAFEKVRNWGAWIALYTGKSLKPDFVVEEDHDYGDGLVNMLFTQFKKEYEKILKIIEIP